MGRLAVAQQSLQTGFPVAQHCSVPQQYKGAYGLVQVQSSLLAAPPVRRIHRTVPFTVMQKRIIFRLQPLCSASPPRLQHLVFSHCMVAQRCLRKHDVKWHISQGRVH